MGFIFGMLLISALLISFPKTPLCQQSMLSEIKSEKTSNFQEFFQTGLNKENFMNFYVKLFYFNTTKIRVSFFHSIG